MVTCLMELTLLLNYLADFICKYACESGQFSFYKYLIVCSRVDLLCIFVPMI